MSAQAGLSRVALTNGHEPWAPLDVAAMPTLAPPAIEPGRLEARVKEFYRTLETDKLRRQAAQRPRQVCAVLHLVATRSAFGAWPVWKSNRPYVASNAFTNWRVWSTDLGTRDLNRSRTSDGCNGSPCTRMPYMLAAHPDP